MKRITFNLNDPIAERWLADACAHGQHQTEVITSALRQAATEAQGRSLREQALHDEIERLHRLIERIVRTSGEHTIASAHGSGGQEPSAPDTWTW